MQLIKLVSRLLGRKEEGLSGEKLEEYASEIAYRLYKDTVYRCVEVNNLRYMKRYSPSQCIVEHMDRDRFRELLELNDYDKGSDKRVIERAYDLYIELLKRKAMPIEDEEKLFEELTENHFKAETACYELFIKVMAPLEEVIGYTGTLPGIGVTYNIASMYLKADMRNPDERKSVANTVRRIIDALNKVAERCRNAAEHK
jgi:hypothetical protein